MRRSRVVAVAVAVVWALPAAAADKPSSNVNRLPSLAGIARATSPLPSRPVMAFPIIDYSAPDGGSAMPRGIIAGRQIAPGTVLGVGIFQTAPKSRGYVGGVPQNIAPRRSKRAALGLSVRF